MRRLVALAAAALRVSALDDFGTAYAYVSCRPRTTLVHGTGSTRF